MNKKYTDFSLNFSPHPLTGDIMPLINIDAIKQSMRVLLSLDNFDLPFKANIKSDIKKFLFENINAVTKPALTKRLEWLIKTFEKRVKLIDIKILSDDDNTFEITIMYQIKALDMNDTYTYSFQRIR